MRLAYGHCKAWPVGHPCICLSERLLRIGEFTGTITKSVYVQTGPLGQTQVNRLGCWPVLWWRTDLQRPGRSEVQT